MPAKDPDPFAQRPLSVEEKDRATAEAEKFRAEARKFAAEADEAAAKAAVAVFAQQREAQKYERELHTDDYPDGVYEFTGHVDQASVTKCMTRLSAWHRAYPKKALEVVFFSPGGAVFPGMQLFDYIQWLRANDHHVTTTSTGYAASMGGILLQAGDTRVITKESWLMVHEVASGASGKTSEMEDEVEFMKRVQERVLQIFADRAAATDRPKAITKTRLRRLSTRKDCWLSSQESYDYGLVDEIR